jgi:hypothetical protein
MLESILSAAIATEKPDMSVLEGLNPATIEVIQGKDTRDNGRCDVQVTPGCDHTGEQASQPGEVMLKGDTYQPPDDIGSPDGTQGSGTR